jgi:hypothetical protein
LLSLGHGWLYMVAPNFVYEESDFSFVLVSN